MFFSQAWSRSQCCITWPRTSQVIGSCWDGNLTLKIPPSSILTMTCEPLRTRHSRSLWPGMKGHRKQQRRINYYMRSGSCVGRISQTTLLTWSDVTAGDSAMYIFNKDRRIMFELQLKVQSSFLLIDPNRLNKCEHYSYTVNTKQQTKN